MKAVVFDNSGTLIERYRAIKNLKTGIICDYISSIDVVDYGPKRVLVVLQTDPTKCIINADPNQPIYKFISEQKIDFDVSYYAVDAKKQDLLEIIKNDNATVGDIQDTIKAVMKKKYNLQICSGSGLILNIDKKKIEFTITAGGRIFKEVPEVIEKLKKRGIEIFVASGDRKGALEKLAEFIGIPKENVFGTATPRMKAEIVKRLKEKYEVMMVGDSTNDILALEEADIGVLTLQQTEKRPKKVYDAADFVISNIKEILEIW